MADVDADIKDIKNQVVAAYVLVGLSPLILLIHVTDIVFLLWVVGLIFSSILVYHRKYIPELQRKLTNLTIIFFIIGLIIFEVLLAGIVSSDANSLVGHISNGKIQTKYLASILYGLLPSVLVGTGILYGVFYATLGIGLVKGRNRILFMAAMAASIILVRASQAISFNNLIASLGPQDSYVTVSSLPSKIAAGTSFTAFYTPTVLLLLVVGTLIMTVSFIVLAFHIYNGKIALIYPKNSEENNDVAKDLE